MNTTHTKMKQSHRSSFKSCQNVLIKVKSFIPNYCPLAFCVDPHSPNYYRKYQSASWNVGEPGIMEWFLKMSLVCCRMTVPVLYPSPLSGLWSCQPAACWGVPPVAAADCSLPAQHQILLLLSLFLSSGTCILTWRHCAAIIWTPNTLQQVKKLYSQLNTTPHLARGFHR